MKKKNIVYIGCFLCVIILFACSNPKDIPSKDYYNVEYYNPKINSVDTTALKLSRILIDTTIECSFVGYFWIFNNTLCFSDEFFGYVYRFFPDGTIIDRQVGIGKGPNEVISLAYSLPLQESYIIVSSSNSFIYRFSDDGNKKSTFRINWKVSKIRANEIIENPDPGNHWSYEFDFGIPNVVQRWENDDIAIGVTSSLNKFNGYFNSKRYYTQSRILAIVDCNSGEIKKIFGRRSPYYLQKENIPNFDHFNFEVLEDNVYLNFWPDYKIYVIDKKKDKALKSFGVPGRNMYTAYRLTNSYEEAEMNRAEDWLTYGYYNYLKVDDELKIIFRGYRRGDNSSTDGMQIYKDYKLIADIDVPKGFSVIGKIRNTYYAQIQNEESGELRLYQFLIDTTSFEK